VGDASRDEKSGGTMNAEKVYPKVSTNVSTNVPDFGGRCHKTEGKRKPGTASDSGLLVGSGDRI
jgi:hypothetical protein